MPNVTITGLPVAGPIQGTESVPIVQNGQTVQTTTAAIAAAPSQFQTFLTINQESTLPNSRYFSTGTGLGTVDNGAQSYFRITLNGASGSLETALTGIVAKDGASSVVARTITSGSSGISITDGNGVSGNPTIALTGTALSLANLASTGMLSIGGGSVNARVLTGTANQIDVANGNGTGNPTFSIASNPIIPGTGAMIIPSGTTAERPIGIDGMVRYNTDTSAFEIYESGSWTNLTAGAVTLINTGTGLTGGPITSTGTISIDSTVVTLSGTQSLTNKTISGALNTLSNIGNSSLTNSSITVNGTAISLGSGGTVTATTTSTLTIGTGLSGTSFNGGSPVTIAIDSSVATLTGVQTLTNKSISGSTNTLTNIPNTALTNSSLTIGSTSVSLGGTTTTLAGLASVTLTQDPSAALEAATKQYVDAVVSGINFHQACQYASTTALPSYTYSNGTGGVGATITANANGPLVLDGHTFVAPADVGLRVLIKNEPSAGGLDAYNGVYTVTQVGVSGGGGSPFILTRATDYDSAGSGPNEINAGDLFLILAGATLANTSWVQQTPLPIIVGTTALTFVQFAAPLTYVAGTGLNESPAYTFNISNTGVTAATYGSASKTLTLAINAQGQITSATASDIAINGNQITSGTVGSSYISGSYTGITGVGTLTAGTWNASTIQALYGGTGITSYSVGDILYASGLSALSKLALGTTNYVLTAGASAPQYVAQSTLSVGSATTATNVAGGTAGAIVYNTGSNASTFLSLGTSNYVLTAGATAPQYVAQSTLSVGSATTATTSTNVAGGAAGSLVYQSAASTTTTLALGTTNYVLTAGATAPQYVAQSTLSVGSATTATTATTATNVSGGATGSLLYQSAASTTTTLALGTTNYVLTAGASAPQYVAQSTLSVGSATTATTATNVSGGAAGSLVYQSGASTTTTLALGTTGYFLTAGATAPQWTSLLTGTYGGTGVNNGSSTITIGGNVTFSGAFAFTGTLTAATSVTFPTSGTLVNTAVTSLSSLATVGTITSGTWNASIINPTYGGTGVNNGSSTLTLAGNVTHAGAFTQTFTATANTSVTLPTTGTLSTLAGAETLTNKRIDPRVSSTTSASSVTPTIASFDQYAFTALAATLTINAPTGTPVDGNKLIFRFLDNGTPQTLSWNATYTAIGVTLPTTTTASKMTYVGCIYNAANTRWDVVAVTTQA